jgi:hypothetical protein
MVHLLKVETMNKICKQDASKKAFYTFSSQNGGSSCNFEKKKKNNERIAKLKKKQNVTTTMKRGNGQKHVRRRKRIRKKALLTSLKLLALSQVLIMQSLQAMDLHIKASYMTG